MGLWGSMWPLFKPRFVRPGLSSRAPPTQCSAPAERASEDHTRLGALPPFLLAVAACDRALGPVSTAFHLHFVDRSMPVRPGLIYCVGFSLPACSLLVGSRDSQKEHLLPNRGQGGLEKLSLLSSPFLPCARFLGLWQPVTTDELASVRKNEIWGFWRING